LYVFVFLSLLFIFFGNFLIPLISI
jgi:hypothetical protein